jgi:surface protein
MNIGAGIGVGFSNPREEPAFEYQESQACKNGSDITPVINNPGGTFSSSPAGLSLNSTTGVIDVSASTVGTYTVTYSIGPTEDTITILPADDASFSYSSTSFRQNASNPAPTITGLVGGVFSGPTGIIFADSGTNTNSSSGIINLAASTVGGPYTITYTTTGNCPASRNFDLSIQVALSITYSAASFCEDGGNTAAPTVVGDPGSGTFASTTGLTINSTTGVINTDTSTPDDNTPYTVTYTASTGETATTTVTIKNLDNATFSYSATSFCENASNQTPSITTPGGTFSAAEAYTPLQLQFSVTSGVEKTISVGITGTNYTIDWGDGTIETNQTGGTKSHIYNVGGSGTTSNPTISIGASADTGPVTNFSIPVKTDLLDIVAWGSLVYSGSWASLFINCTNLASQISATDGPNIANVTAFGDLFRNTSFDSDIDHWDVSSNTNISNMFKASTSFNQSLNSWNTGSVINMAGVFQQASSFNGDVSNWNTSSVTSFSALFYLASNFNKDVSSWDVSSCTNFFYMFRGASNFSKNLAGWYVNGLNAGITSMSNMFRSTSMTSAQFTDTIVGWAVAVRRDSSPYNINAATVSPSSFDATRTQDTDNSGNSVDYDIKYGSDWDSNWNNAGDARQFLLDNGWSVS